ncbi:MAG: B12-binding domain-containing radical SAM protein [Chloroflexi bacterium]|nr:B12-binding domain-containing radical SAM protein [Chloroflexota bacterium]
MTTFDSLLRRVQKAARYAGGEWNSVRKDWDATPVHVAVIYPDLYEVGMTCAGVQELYQTVNSRPSFLMERAFAPAPDLANELRRERVPLWSLESRRSLATFNVICFWLERELAYPAILEVMDLAGLPFLSRERDERQPLIVAAGRCCNNPEPLADFFDLFLIGDGVDGLVDLLSLYQATGATAKGHRPQKETFLEHAATMPGVYVPGLYNVRSLDCGVDASVAPLSAGVPEVIHARHGGQERVTLRPIVPLLQTVRDWAVLPVQQRWLTGDATRDFLEDLDRLIRQSGYEEIELAPPEGTGPHALAPLVRAVRSVYPPERLGIALPGLPPTPDGVALAAAASGAKKSSLTLAVQAGSERLRRMLGMDVPDDVVLQAVASALASGWSSFKLQFLLGLPKETMSDVEAIASLVMRVSAAASEQLGRPLRMRVVISPFIPRPHTPFQWCALETLEALGEKTGFLKRGVRRRADLTIEPLEPRLIEALLARGDRRLGAAVLAAWRKGAVLDSQVEHFRYEPWLEALSETGLDMGHYLHRERGLLETLPWDHIVVRQPKERLAAAYQQMTTTGPP